MNALLQSYIIRPLKVILSNISLMVLILVVLILDKLAGQFDFAEISVKEVLSGKWFFEELPRIVLPLITNPVTILLILLLAVIKAFVLVALFGNFKLIYQATGGGFLNSLGSLKTESILWSILWNTLLSSLYLAVGLILYMPGYILWHSQRLSLMLPLIIIIGMIFPLFYAFLSIESKMAVIPLPWGARNEKMLALLRVKNLIRIYTFYPIRLLLESLCYIIFPFAVLTLIPNRLLAYIVISLSIFFPLAILRASTYEFFLTLYQDDDTFRSIFSSYYRVS